MAKSVRISGTVSGTGSASGMNPGGASKSKSRAGAASKSAPSARRRKKKKPRTDPSVSAFGLVSGLLRRMNLFTHKKNYRKYHPAGPLWLRGTVFVTLCIVVGIEVTICVQWISMGELADVWAWAAKYSDPFILTVFLYAVVTAVLGSVIPFWTAGAAVSAFGLILALVDYFKRTIDGAPLVLSDFGLAARAGNVAGVAGALWPPVMFWQSFGILLLCVAGLFFIGPLTQMRLSHRGGTVRLISSLTAFVILFSGLFSPQLGDLFRVDVVTRLDPSSSHNTYGLTVSLWRELYLRRKAPPEDYGEEFMRGILGRVDELLTQPDMDDGQSDIAGPIAPGTMPNVIIVLSESFFDPTRLDGVSFSRDPVVNFHALQAESISGPFYTHYLGYGTGYIELSMQTGFTAPDLGAATNLCFMDEAMYERFDSLAEQYTNTGFYTAEMLHAYDNSLYNRTVTYPLMGYSRSLYSRDIQAMEIPREVYGGYYMRDGYLFQGVLREMREINADGQRAFLYAITMENHQPYQPDKFGVDYPFQVDVNASALDADELAILRVGVEGLVRADQALRELTDALRSYPEPTIVAFFGDHRPTLAMPDGETVYTKLGITPGSDTSIWTPEQFEEIYSTDYLIWANRAALLRGRAGTVKAEGALSLGTELLRLSGRNVSRYWRLLELTADIQPVNTELYFVNGEGNVYLDRAAAGLSAREEEIVYLRECVIYDALYGRRYITAEMNQPMNRGTRAPP